MPWRRLNRDAPFSLVMHTFAPNLPTMDRRRLRRAYLASHVFELLIAVMGVLAGLSFFLDPDALTRSAIGEALHPFDQAWNTLYLLSGLTIIYGLTRPAPRVELLGLSAFAGAVLGNCVALAALRGTAAFGVTATYIAVAAALCVRAWMIVVTIQGQNDAVRRLKGD